MPTECFLHNPFHSPLGIDGPSRWETMRFLQI